jgi:hypothetical protein
LVAPRSAVEKNKESRNEDGVKGREEEGPKRMKVVY